MSESSEIGRAELLAMTADIVSAHIKKNPTAHSDLPDLLESVFAKLDDLAANKVEEEPLVPAVPIRKSVQNDYLVCLEDGKQMKMLKRHLRTAYDMSPDEYRARWGLPSDYPMVAPSYASRRSELAKTIGLGRKKKPEPEANPAAKPAAKPARKRAASKAS